MFHEEKVREIVTWPLSISFLSILRLNDFLDNVPKTLTRKNVFSLSERSNFVADYLRLGLGFEVAGVRLTNHVVATTLVAASGTALASLMKIVQLAQYNYTLRDCIMWDRLYRKNK
eukprot:SAG22_NODE_722_length_7641_cov_13.307876_6_plen_116_part_00